MTATARKMSKCHCQSFEFGTYGPTGEHDDYESFTTECTEVTYKTFAMGHDAKLAGFLVRAELDGLDISQDQGGTRVTFAGAVAAAQTVSDAFAAKVTVQLMAGVARAMKKAAAKDRKASKTEAPAPAAPKPVTAKIGRWTYTGFVGLDTGDFVYEMKSGEMRTAKRGDYKVL